MSVEISKREMAALARKAHHKKQLASKVRVDTYVDPVTKEGLGRIKAYFSGVKNEGLAIDKAVAIAIASLDGELY